MLDNTKTHREATRFQTVAPLGRVPIRGTSFTTLSCSYIDCKDMENNVILMFELNMVHRKTFFDDNIPRVNWIYLIISTSK